MQQRHHPPRMFRRVAPRQSATVAVSREEQELGYGIIVNLSEEGTCIVTDRPISSGTDVRLQLSFYQQPELIELGARVVWHRRAGAKEQGLDGLELHGLRFLRVPFEHRSRLYRLLSSEAFETISTSSATEFDRLTSALERELHALGDKLGRSTGGK